MVKLKLYITGRTPSSKKLTSELQTLLKHKHGEAFTLEVYDVCEQIDAAYADKVMATPTLIKQQPAPERRVVGDLRDVQRIFSALNLNNRAT